MESMNQGPETLFEQAVPVACGNSWESLEETLPGNDRARFCGDCERSVHNLSQMTPEEVDALLKTGKRLCVVLEAPSNNPWQLTASLFRLPMRYAALFLMVMLAAQSLMNQAWAEAAQKQTNEPVAKECSTLMYKPMLPSPDEVCLDEHGKQIKSGEWMSEFYKNLKKNEAKPVKKPKGT